MVQRVQGSPDLIAAPLESVNFLACHDGFTLHDLVAYDRKHNEANGWGGTDGSDDNRSWNCGWEGEDGAPADVVALRRRQLRNAWCLVMMSHGTPMVGMGDECGRTQGGNNNAYNQDDATSWFDWDRAAEWADLERFCRRAAGAAPPPPRRCRSRRGGVTRSASSESQGPLDQSFESRSLAWCVDGLYVIANAWWEPLRWTILPAGPWRRVVDTSLPPPDDIDLAGVPFDGLAYDVAPRSVVILERLTHRVFLGGRTTPRMPTLDGYLRAMTSTLGTTNTASRWSIHSCQPARMSASSASVERPYSSAWVA